MGIRCSIGLHDWVYGAKYLNTVAFPGRAYAKICSRCGKRQGICPVPDISGAIFYNPKCDTVRFEDVERKFNLKPHFPPYATID